MHRVFNKGAPFRTGSGSLRSMNVVCVSPLYHFPNCSFFLVKISKVSLSKMLGSTLVIYSSPFLVEIRVLSSVTEAPGWHLFACHLGLTIGFPSWVAVVIEDLVHLGGTCRAFLNWPKCIDFYPSVGFGHQVVCWNGSRSQSEFRHTSDACIRQKVQEWSYDLLLEARGSPGSVLGPVNKSSQERLTPDRYHSSQQEGWPPPSQISGQGMENLWGRLQMLHFLIWVVVMSLFANVKFHRAVCALRLVHITICKVCLSKK